MHTHAHGINCTQSVKKKKKKSITLQKIKRTKSSNKHVFYMCIAHHITA